MKIKKLQNLLKKEEISMLFLSSGDKNIDYLTQNKSSHSFLVIEQNFARFYITKLDNIISKGDYKIKLIPPMWKKEFYSEGIVKIAINKQAITLSFYNDLKKIYPKAEFIDFSTNLSELRQSKKIKEIDLIRNSCKLADDALKLFVKSFKKENFQTEISISLFLERFVRTKGGNLSFPIIVANKENSAIPHHITSNKRLESGFLLIDFGVEKEGYCSDMTRMFYIGTPSEDELNNFRLLLLAQEKAIRAVNLAEKFSNIDNIVREELKDKEKLFIHSLGHGIGVEVHENPRISTNSIEKVRSNSVFTIEPGIYFKNKYGIRIEDIIFFDGEKVEILTKSPKELILLN